MKLARWVALACALLALALCQHAQGPRHREPGVLVADAPLQRALDDPPRPMRKGDIAIKPLATFSMSARVLSREDYSWDRSAAISPVDLALGWGRMSDSSVLEKIDISQSARFFFWRVKKFPIPEQELIESAANMHMVPADASVERAIKRARVGDVVTFDGYLIEADWPDGGKWISSLTRSDSGAGACELVWVEHFDIATR